MTEPAFHNFLTKISKIPLRVIDNSCAAKDYVAIDLSSENSDLDLIDVASSKALEIYIDEYCAKSNAKVAYGGYLERRSIYDRSTYFNQESSIDRRNIHLGIDLWCPAGTDVLAVLDGHIHSFQNNTNFGDYGPTIIVKHVRNDVTFYSLYGHLSLDSIAMLEIGQPIIQGEVIGSLGDSSVNGDYAPHLHFQLIRDLGGKFGDYPGVTSAKNLTFYQRNCPNPNTLLKLS